MQHDATNGALRYQGGCHCGLIRYEVEVDLAAGVSRCNCSICTQVAHTSTCVKPRAFRVMTGESNASTYAFGGRTARRYFCWNCGIHCYLRGSLPELGGDYVSVNLNTLDDPGVLAGVPVQHWDGRHDNWDAGPRASPWPVTAIDKAA